MQQEAKDKKAKDLEKGETKPLLSERRDSKPQGTLAGIVAGIPIIGGKFGASNEPPIIAYDPEQLTNWKAIISLNGTIFMQPAVMFIITSQFLLAGSVAVLLAFVTKDPGAYKSDAMDSLVKTIAVSIAFLLGMFLSSCINRWWDTIKSLESLFGTIKRLTMTAINLELPKDKRHLLAQRCVLSARCLQVELIENHMILSGKMQSDALEGHWDEHFKNWLAEKWINAGDKKVLSRVPAQQRSFFAWSLVSQEMIALRPTLVGQGGAPDVMAYDRLCGLVQDGVSSVSNVRTAAAFQMPYVYVHLLAFMIHFVNMLTALGTGIRIGLLIAVSQKDKTTLDVNEIGTALVFLLVQAFIYQSFLTIGAALSFPITGSAYRIPLLNMVQSLDKQLQLMNLLANDVGKDEKDINQAEYAQDTDEEFFD